MHSIFQSKRLHPLWRYVLRISNLSTRLAINNASPNTTVFKESRIKLPIKPIKQLDVSDVDKSTNKNQPKKITKEDKVLAKIDEAYTSKNPQSKIINCQICGCKLLYEKRWGKFWTIYNIKCTSSSCNFMLFVTSG